MMTRRPILLLLSLFALVLARAGEAPVAAPSVPASANPPAKSATVPMMAPAANWVLPIFTDKEGYHLITLRGASAQAAGPDRIVVTDFSATVFSGDAKETVDNILLSPKAVFFPRENRASGDGPVRFIRGDVEVTGVGWTYDHVAKRVSLAHNVRVVFQAQLNDILK